MSIYHEVTTTLFVDEHGEPTWIARARLGDGAPVLGQGPTMDLAAADLVRKMRAVASREFDRLDPDSQRAVREGMSQPGSIEADIAAHPADRVFRNA